eukprot:m.14108 g.14108  ORF g.14108 m.14108 type:complete len:168 (+) comp7756_c0_seq2:77-580(+)
MTAARFVLVLAVAFAFCAVPTEARFTANVIVYNLLNSSTLVFDKCVASPNITLPVQPHSVAPQQVARFFVDTQQVLEDVSGFCWWHIEGSSVKCDPDAPPKPVTSCPWIGWQRVVVAGQESIDWECETPGHFGIGDVSITKRLGHESKQYCICEPSEPNCQKTCAEI